MYFCFLYVGLSPIIQITSVDTVYDLNGISECMGGGAGLGIDFSVDAVHIVNPALSDDEIQGIQISLPVLSCGFGVDMHIVKSYILL